MDIRSVSDRGRGLQNQSSTPPRPFRIAEPRRALVLIVPLDAFQSEATDPEAMEESEVVDPDDGSVGEQPAEDVEVALDVEAVDEIDSVAKC